MCIILFNTSNIIIFFVEIIQICFHILIIIYVIDEIYTFFDVTINKNWLLCFQKVSITSKIKVLWKIDSILKKLQFPNFFGVFKKDDKFNFHTFFLISNILYW